MEEAGRDAADGGARLRVAHRWTSLVQILRGLWIAGDALLRLSAGMPRRDGGRPGGLGLGREACARRRLNGLAGTGVRRQSNCDTGLR